MLVDSLKQIATTYAYERAKPFAKSPFGEFVRHDLAVEAQKQLFNSPIDLLVRASVGAGQWAAVPWLAFFDPLITDTATKGFYVVYLINPQNYTITLSMNQGTTEIYAEFGRPRGRDVLKRRAKDIANRVPEYAHSFTDTAIRLGSNSDLPAGYEAGHAFGKTYQADKIVARDFIADLHSMLRLYDLLIQRGGITPAEIMHFESGSSDIEETRKYILSRRIERSPKVRKAVLSAKSALVCEGCGLDPRTDYGYSGSKENTPLDVHHAAPLSGLGEGQTKRYKIPDDFMLLCPTCHRVIHMQTDPSDLKKLKASLRFRRAHEVDFSIL